MLVDLICHFWRNDPSLPFRVKLHDLALRHLMTDATEAWRVYELMCIQRPGDVWKYIWVELLDVPESVHSLRSWRKQNAMDAYNWKENWLPLAEFDHCFYWAYDDTTRESACWLNAREGQSFRDWADELFSEVRATQAALRQSTDLLVRTELARIDQKRHTYDYAAQTPLELTSSDYRSPVIPGFPTGLYAKLRELLAQPEVTCVSFLQADYQAVRLAYEQQRLRSSPDPLTRANRWPICVSADKVYGTAAWNGEVQLYSEGVGFGFVFICSKVPTWLLNKGWFRWLLCSIGAGEVPGYRHTEGDGWHLYEDLLSEQAFSKQSEHWRERIHSFWNVEV